MKTNWLYHRETQFFKGSLFLFCNLALIVADFMPEEGEPYKLQFLNGVADSELVRSLSQKKLPILNADKLTLELLYPNNTTRFYFLITNIGYMMSLAIRPCTSNVEWFLRYRNGSNTGKLDDPKFPEMLLTQYTGSNSVTYINNASQGLYTIEITALDDHTYVEFYLKSNLEEIRLEESVKGESDEAGRRLRFHQIPNKSIEVKWPRSHIDKNTVRYCLVVNTRRYYKSMCEARSECSYKRTKYCLELPEKDELSGSEYFNVRPSKDDIQIKCVKSQNKYIMNDAVDGMKYYFNVFLVNQNDFTMPFANGSILYQRKKPIGLKDGKAVVGNIKHNNGKLSFRYKVSRRFYSSGNNEILWYVIPCGGIINIEIIRKKEVVVPKRRIKGYTKLIVKNPLVGGRYVLKISVVEPDELSRFSAVEVFASIRSNRFPLPDAPEQLSLQMYENLASCQNGTSSVTIGWLPMYSDTTVTYCIHVKRMNDNEKYNTNVINQCKENLPIMKLQRMFDFIKCQKKPQNQSEVIIQKLRNLQPDVDYLIQVTARKTNFKKSISYNLLKIHHNISCT